MGKEGGYNKIMWLWGWIGRYMLYFKGLKGL